MAMNRKISRGVGFCMDSKCEEHAKGVFLLNHGDKYICSRCKYTGFLEVERSYFEGEGGVFKEVRVEFDFHPLKLRYNSLAIVRDDSIWEQGNVYYLLSPLIKTEKRALKIAESLLSNLQRFPNIEQGEMVTTQEIIISLDDDKEEYRKQLKRLYEKLQGSPRAIERGKNA